MSTTQPLSQQHQPIPIQIVQVDDFDRQIIVSSAKKTYPKCEVCSKKQAKYTCPNCQQKTCSLLCSKKHKQYTGCSGTRQPTKYISKKEYDPKDSKRDYNYLLTTIDSVDRVKKDFTGINSLTNDQKSLKLLKKYGKQMYQIDLKIAPTIMEKHRNNISFFFMKTNEFFWVFELCYLTPQDNKYQNFSTQPICDSMDIKQVFVQQRVSNSLLTKWEINTAKTQDFHIMLKNRYRYGFLSPDSYGFGKEQFFYIEIGLYERIVDVMKGLTIYQFPSLIMVHKSLIDKFTTKFKCDLIKK